MASVDEVAGGTLGDINIGLVALNISLPALSAQLDAALALGLGPLKADLAVQLNASLAAQASISLSIGDPFDAIRKALLAVAQLQAALQIALSLPPVQLTLSAELSAMAALAGTLSAKLGLIDGIIQAALAVKLPAISLSEGIGAALGLGPAILLAFDGISDGTTLPEIGNLIASKLQFPVSFGGDTIETTDNVSGILLLTTAGSTYTALAQLFAGL